MSLENQNLMHIPVLAEAVTAVFADAPRMVRLIDGTLGNGGHTKKLLLRYPELNILGIDRDTSALERAKANLGELSSRVIFEHGEFADLAQIARKHNWNAVDGVLLDIGVSSPQIDDPARGFSWRMDGPLDMRMDRNSELTASRVVNFYSEAELARIFYEYGEVRQSRKLAAELVKAREKRPFATTTELVNFIEQVLGRAKLGKLPTPTLVFQGLRIAVNAELDQLRGGLDQALDILGEHGRMAIISFHSLEDRIVKNFMREKARGCICPPGLPVCICHHQPELRVLERGVVTADVHELEQNRRAASAKLRAAEKL